jgi:hypothetical protein
VWAASSKLRAVRGGNRLELSDPSTYIVGVHRLAQYRP